MNNLTKLIAALGLMLSLSVDAAIVEISYPGQDVVRAKLLDIVDLDDRVYTVIVDPDGAASIRFGDGILGARPSSGGAVIGSYRYDTGNSGKIVNEYEIFANDLPFIPITDFRAQGNQQPDASFVLAGLASITFDFSPTGLRVIAADIRLAPVPLPPAVLLFATALAGLAGFGRLKYES